MAITKEIINGDFTKLATFLTNSGFVTAVNDSGTVKCYDDDGNLLATITLPAIRLYWEDCTNPLAITFSNMSSTAIKTAYACANGIIIAMHTTDTWTSGYTAYTLITKNNNDDIVFVSSFAPDNLSKTNRQCVKKFFPVAWTDDGTIANPDTGVYNAVSFAIESTDGYWNQSALVPFPTYAKSGEISYTPNAGFFLVSPNYAIGEGAVQFNGYRYLTNGFWAIKDEAV